MRRGRIETHPHAFADTNPRNTFMAEANVAAARCQMHQRLATKRFDQGNLGLP